MAEGYGGGTLLTQAARKQGDRERAREEGARGQIEFPRSHPMSHPGTQPEVCLLIFLGNFQAHPVDS